MDIQLSGIGMTSARTRDRLVQRLRDAGIQDERILDTIRNTPRHLFIEEALAHQAYDDTALPIGHGQTISQPWVVARMTELLMAGDRRRKILEIGTGCGYQTAVLAPYCDELYSVERIRPLQDQARKRLLRLGLAKVQLKHADGGFGWKSEAPFDGILAACARADIPQELLDQLADGGRLVMPVGDDRKQILTVVDRDGDEFHSQSLDAVRFVPFQRGVMR
ncbi:MAG: protein-L-isoaspartate O-methyltransferase [Alcanivoracaceae bacterium]|uniref:protein-L-isoaspartate(D-aspartate) O-methyltransferase n=1 Tax=Alcanivorax sp. MD8A TaxID=1177157 RepID=UPI000C6859C2|nr:protein-L-isoaspartate(D-aspartate) O-methyltransferase [Alcanivorax sp. MD8A]MAX54011.1 protein-L-isoaspartate O-methyltransferase [Alcanivoracaceae bacterium]MCG8438967.1 protein-L-isoaspartate(D-aspartate) O-methyltransferase [Pseudomonadales bacterium]MED5431126.1 protein-L-isoaspartate(D-aspartate) O-methyltransferase [Pseudomonadota bacterium]MEE2870363.1 protein-L-isoaspartate(D-aspartate) O-methyltransferase [Pseudomonadota bacterium]PNE03225.1 protein-L-isoaspartate(D-aspartate) O-|tara:strand:- start:1504 stop:2166 length:663 start_codon:yes stop_codon:yes gene_type:complete